MNRSFSFTPARLEHGASPMIRVLGLQINLALEVDDGAAFLAEIALAGDQLRFKLIGGKPTDSGLAFSRSK
jgi:hypothetical protein